MKMRLLMSATVVIFAAAASAPTSAQEVIYNPGTVRSSTPTRTARTKAPAIPTPTVAPAIGAARTIGTEIEMIRASSGRPLLPPESWVVRSVLPARSQRLRSRGTGTLTTTATGTTTQRAMGSFANVERGSRVQTADGILANECPSTPTAVFVVQKRHAAHVVGGLSIT